MTAQSPASPSPGIYIWWLAGPVRSWPMSPGWVGWSHWVCPDGHHSILSSQKIWHILTRPWKTRVVSRMDREPRWNSRHFSGTPLSFFPAAEESAVLTQYGWGSSCRSGHCSSWGGGWPMCWTQSESNAQDCKTVVMEYHLVVFTIHYAVLHIKSKCSIWGLIKHQNHKITLTFCCTILEVFWVCSRTWSMSLQFGPSSGSSHPQYLQPMINYSLCVNI